MAIPTKADGDLASIEEAASTVLLRLRNYHHAGPGRDPRSIKQALQAYLDKVVDFVNAD